MQWMRYGAPQTFLQHVHVKEHIQPTTYSVTVLTHSEVPCHTSSQASGRGVKIPQSSKGQIQAHPPRIPLSPWQKEESELIVQRTYMPAQSGPSLNEEAQYQSAAEEEDLMSGSGCGTGARPLSNFSEVQEISDDEDDFCVTTTECNGNRPETNEPRHEKTMF